MSRAHPLGSDRCLCCLRRRCKASTDPGQAAQRTRLDVWDRNRCKAWDNLVPRYPPDNAEPEVQEHNVAQPGLGEALRRRIFRFARRSRRPEARNRGEGSRFEFVRAYTILQGIRIGSYRKTHERSAGLILVGWREWGDSYHLVQSKCTTDFSGPATFTDSYRLAIISILMGGGKK